MSKYRLRNYIISVLKETFGFVFVCLFFFFFNPYVIMLSIWALFERQTVGFLMLPFHQFCIFSGNAHFQIFSKHQDSVVAKCAMYHEAL